MALDTPPTDAILTEPIDGEDAYDEAEAKKLATWIWDMVQDDAGHRKVSTREDRWQEDWEFLRGKQWAGAMPSYRRPIKMNAWRRAHHAELAVLLGGRPTLKLVPQGQIEDAVLKVWQDALWAIVRKEQLFEIKAPDAYSWALVGDGGFYKVGFGSWAAGTGEESDVLISAPHPGQIYPDKDCTDMSLVHCHHITFRDRLDLATLTGRYPDQGMRVTSDDTVSLKWGGGPPAWTKDGITTIGPAGGWSASGAYRRGMADVAECWIDDPGILTVVEREVVNMEAVVTAWLAKMNGRSFEEKAKLLGLGARDAPGYQQILPRLISQFGGVSVEPEMRDVKKLKWAYPKGRVITCTREVILRDIPNPFAKAWSWAQRWPFIFVPGAVDPHVVWRPGVLSDMSDLQWAINKSLSLLVENSIKVTNAMVIADESAMEDDEWDMLQLFPGVKIRKNQGTDVSVVFPQPLPPQAFQLPDYLIRKLEEAVGLQDPPIAPGQAVAAKTVAFMQQKGSFLLGIVAKGMDESLERLGSRVVGLMRDRYLPNREIPFMEGEKMAGGMATQKLPTLPGNLQLRVEATSAYQEQVATAQVLAQAAEQARADRRR
jgi:hypothetical protein